MMTDALKNAYQKLCMSFNEDVSLVFEMWIKVSPELALDVKALVSTLVVDADILNERGSSSPRKIIRGRQRGLLELAKLSSSTPWNELLVARPTGEVILNEALTREDVAELCSIYSRYASCLWDPSEPFKV